MIPPRLPCRSQSLGKVAKNRLNVQILLEHHRHGEDVVDDVLDDVVDDDHEDILDYLHLGWGGVENETKRGCHLLRLIPELSKLCESLLNHQNLNPGSSESSW